LALILSSCTSTVRLKDLDCERVLGQCSASIEPEGYNWFVKSDSECGVVTKEDFTTLPFCGYKAYLGQGGDYGIQPGSCRVCVHK
jgi:hypothetical protein